MTTMSPAHILEIGLGFFASKTLLSAVELGVFTHLAQSPKTAADLGNEIELHPRSRRDFLDALVSLRLLDREGDGATAIYRNTAESALFLDRRSPAYTGGMLEMANSRLYGFWGNLSEALRTGEPQNEARHSGESVFDAIYANPERLEQFLGAMAGISMGNFLKLAGEFEMTGYQTLCDVGGAGGQLACVLAETNPHLQAKTLDLPPVQPLAEEQIASRGLSDRVTAVAGDFLKEELPESDVITMGMILHDWDTPTKKMLIEKVYRALPEGGVFIAIESLLDDARRTQTSGLLMSLNMLIETTAGGEYTGAEFTEWCQAAGFKTTQFLPLAGPSTAAIAIK